MEAESFETFLGEHFPASKRFGAEGVESLLPGLQALIRHAAVCGVTHVELGKHVSRKYDQQPRARI